MGVENTVNSQIDRQFFFDFKQILSQWIAVKDARQRGRGIVFDLPGVAGTIDFVDLIKRFHAGGYRGDFNCEVSGMVSSKEGYDPIAAAKTCYSNMSAAFRKAGVARVG